MFNWVCPQCGRDVPPSKTECPHCAEMAKQHGESQPVSQPGAQESARPAWQQPQPAWNPPPAQTQTWTGWQPPPQPVAPQPAPPQPHAWQSVVEPPAAPPHPHWPPPEPARAETPRQDVTRPSYAPPAPPHPGQPQNWGVPPTPPGPPPHQPPPPGTQAWPPPSRPGLPTWALTAIFTVAFIAVGAVVYFGIQRFSRTNPAEKAGLQESGTAAAAKVTNPLQKYVEVVGIRMFTEKSKPVVRFVVVNHSNTEINDLGANVTLWASTSRSEEDAVGSFSFKAGTVGPEESKELTEPLKTKLKVYELPDWQNATADISITSPQP